MNPQKSLHSKRTRRVARVRSKIHGTASRPRLAVFRSNKYISLQLIDDEKGQTLASVSHHQLQETKKSKSEKAMVAGEELAKKAKERGITRAVFDRRAYKYHGRIKAAAEGARKGGLKI